MDEAELKKRYTILRTSAMLNRAVCRWTAEETMVSRAAENIFSVPCCIVARDQIEVAVDSVVV